MTAALALPLPDGETDAPAVPVAALQAAGRFGGEGPRLVTVGTVNAGATEIQADVSTLGAEVFVTLKKDYAMAHPIGYPTRPHFRGAAAESLTPRIIPGGARFAVHACEALALVNAGAAVLS